jgi:hypothetical protein
VRAKLVLAWSIGFAVLGGCRFDRSPLSSGNRGDGVMVDAAIARGPDASSGLGEDAAASGDSGKVAANAGDGSLADADVPETDAAVSDAASLDAALVPEDSGTTAPPMPRGLACGGSFCAFGVGAEKPCCTTGADVAAHAAHAVDRCGLDLSAVPGSAYGQQCWQRDQLGIVDDRCPSSAANGGGSAEPGCCSDDGTCGTLNADHKLGCRHPSGGAPRACAMQPGGSTCDPLGTFGIWFTVDTAWGGRSGGLWDLTDDGRGKIEVFLLAKISHVDAGTKRIESTGRVCGVRLPPFYSTTLCEAYQPMFPIEIWESSKLPELSLTGQYDCAANGCVLSIDPKTYLLGFDLTNPEAPWPGPSMVDQLRCGSGRGDSCFPDHDDDGRPGVGVTLSTTGMATGTCRNGRYMYRGAPLSASVAAIFDGVRRTDRLQLGVRTKLGGTTRFAKDCDRGQGSGVAEYVNSRAAGCLVQKGTFNWPNGARPAGDADPCEPAEASFLDENLPEYTLLAAGQTPSNSLSITDRQASRGPEVKAVRLGDVDADVSCADVRDAKY